jgi:bifunctional DNase/RNase
MKRVDLAGLAFEAMSGSPLIVLREQDDPHRILPIFVAGPDAAAIALAASGQVPPRPLTHDLMATLVRRLDGHVDAVEVTELRDGAFIASMSIHGPLGEDRVDTRPSDAIALAVRLGAPLFVAEAVLDEAGTVPADDGSAGDESARLDPISIDAAVDEFRTFLDDIDPSQFELDDRTGHDQAEDLDDPGG